MKITERSSGETGREYALRVIKENVVSLELEPGSPISENELAYSLGLSRTPVREALMELAGMRLIEVVPQKHSVVAHIDFDLVEEYSFARDLLECAVVREACLKATKEDLNALRGNVAMQHFYLENFYSDTLTELDNLFHGILFRIAGKSYVYSVLQDMSVHFDRVRNLALTNVKNDKIVADHEALLSAIESRSPDEAAALMQKHLARYTFDREELRSRYPDYFRE